MATSPIPIARILRRNATDTEKFLWRHLRASSASNFKFRRQQPIGNFVVDFVCFEAKLIIELDGGQHLTQQDADAERDAWLLGQGFRILRFWNNEVFNNLEGVLQTICTELAPSPQPSPIEGEGVVPKELS